MSPLLMSTRSSSLRNLQHLNVVLPERPASPDTAQQAAATSRSRQDASPTHRLPWRSDTCLDTCLDTLPLVCAVVSVYDSFYFGPGQPPALDPMRQSFVLHALSRRVQHRRIPVSPSRHHPCQLPKPGVPAAAVIPELCDCVPALPALLAPAHAVATTPQRER